MPTIPYAAQTWTDSVSDVSAARMTVIENGIKELSYAPAVRAYHNANQSITSSTATALALNSERFDQVANAADTMHDNTTNNSRLTCRYAGVYLITGTIQYAANATGSRDARIRLSTGSTTIGFARVLNTGGTNDCIVTVSTLYSLAVNEYVELLAWQDSGGALNAVAAGNYSPEFSMVRVG